MNVKHPPATPLPWTRISDQMLKEDGKTVNPNLPYPVCQHCHKASPTPNPAQIQISTKAWGIAAFVSLHPVAEHDAHLQNARYVVHAANSYPKLVEALRALIPLLDQVPVFQLDDGKSSVKAVRLAGKFLEATKTAGAVLRELDEAA